MLFNAVVSKEAATRSIRLQGPGEAEETHSDKCRPPEKETRATNTL